MKSDTKIKKEYDIAVIGEINADLILSGNVEPEFNQIEQVVDRADLVIGSSAVIFSCGIAKLGLKTTFIGKVGDDVFGNFMLASMKQRGIDISSARIDKNINTGLSVILNKTDDRAILTYPGSIPELVFSEIDLEKISLSRHLHLSGFYLLDKLRGEIPYLFKIVKEMGLSISLDTNYDPLEVWDGNIFEALKYVDVFLPNEKEAFELSKTETIKSALNFFSERVPIIVIKQGEDGASAQQKDDHPIFHAAFPVEVIDAVGAGDSFNGGFLYGYLNNWALKKSLEFAVACGSSSVRSVGGTDGQPTLDEATSFIKKHCKERM